MRVLIATVHRPNRSPSQRYRFEQYLDYLSSKGFNFEFSYLLDAADDYIFYSPGRWLSKARIALQSIWKRWLESRYLSDYDIVLVQREAIFLGTSFFEQMVARSRAKLIFDFDDAIWLPNISAANRRLSFLKRPKKIAEIIRQADLVIAGNDYLKAYAELYNRNVMVIPTTIDTRFYSSLKQHRQKETVVIGWTGSMSTIEHFRFLLPVLRRLKQHYKNKIELRLIGDPYYREVDLCVWTKAWQSHTEVDDLMSFDIGIMPLPDNAWTQGKCGLKGLQYMALGIPAVMSPVGVNRQIIQDGQNGFLASDEEEWFHKLALLIEDADLRQRLGWAGRKTVEERYSVLANQEKYLQAFMHVFADSDERCTPIDTIAKNIERR